MQGSPSLSDSSESPEAESAVTQGGTRRDTSKQPTP